MIKVFNRDGSIKDVMSFPPGGEYTEATEKGCLDLKGKRAISLGKSMLVNWILDATYSKMETECPIFI